MSCDSCVGGCPCKPARLGGLIEFVTTNVPDGGETVLEEAARIVDGDRNAAYGDPDGNHGCTAAMWTAYLHRRGLLVGDLDARDVCMLNVLQKASRDAHWRQRDNLTDIAGYVRNAEIVAGQ